MTSILALGLLLGLVEGQEPGAEPRGRLENTADACRDGRDNDGDRRVDCDDPDCGSLRFCVPLRPENTADACRDGIDNDEDGAPDCADSECMALVFCASSGAPTPAPAPSPPARRLVPENNPQRCQDGVDNDGDGLFDCFDRDCSSLPVCAPRPRGRRKP